MRVLVCAVVLAGCGEVQPRAVPSPIPNEAAHGVRTLAITGADAFRFDGGEIVCGTNGAIGYRAPAGMIFALNAQGEHLAQTPPTNRSWRPLEIGLRPDASAADVQRVRDLGATTC